MFDLEEIIEIIVMIVFIASFLCAFYFLYVVDVEDQIVVSQVDYIVTDFMNDITILPDDKLDIIKNALKKYKKPDTSASDKEVQDNNDALYKNVIIMICVIFVICMILCFIVCRYYKIDFLSICGKNLIILVFVALTEYTFLNVYVRNYITADPSFVKLSILNKITA